MVKYVKNGIYSKMRFTVFLMVLSGFKDRTRLIHARVSDYGRNYAVPEGLDAFKVVLKVKFELDCQ
jgi:hypothetical protein